MRGSNLPSEALHHFDQRITPLLLFLFARNLFTAPGNPRGVLAALAIVGLSLSVHGTYQYLFTAA